MPQDGQDQLLKQQNQELQRQLKIALAKLDSMAEERPELRRTKLPAGPVADTSIFEAQQAASLHFVYFCLL